MNVSLLIFASAVSAVLSFLFDMTFPGENMFARSGSLLVIYGAIFESKYILRSHKSGETVFSGTVTIKDSDETESEAILSRLSKHAGFAVVLIGTFFWGYGDLLTNYINNL